MKFQAPHPTSSKRIARLNLLLDAVLNYFVEVLLDLFDGINDLHLQLLITRQKQLARILRILLKKRRRLLLHKQIGGLLAACHLLLTRRYLGLQVQSR